MATNPVHADTSQACQPSVRLVRHSEYVEAHQELLDAMSAMEELTNGPLPDSLRLSHTRLRVTRASLERRALFRRVVGQLSRHPAPSVGRSLAILQDHDRELLDLTNEHIATWTPARMKADWPGYCESTREIRSRSRENIERERELLYPLLGFDPH